jgi:hypothetical protein
VTIHGASGRSPRWARASSEEPADWLIRLWRHAPALSRLAAYTTSILAGAAFIYHIAHGSTAFLGLLEDDYFYYAIIADNFVTNGTLSYDGTTLTNGFHPLWFMVMVLLRAVCGRFGSTFYIALTLVSVASMIVTYELGRRFARELGASAPLSSAIAAVYSIGTARLFTAGMEAVLAVPLFLWLLIEVARGGPVTPRRASTLGLMASLVILARLDIAIAVALLLAGFVLFVRPPAAVLWRQAVAFAAGGILVPLYAAANFVFMGSPFPMSMLAKGFPTTIGFNVKYAQIVALGTVYGPTISLVLPLGLLALFLLVLRDPRKRPAARFAGGLTLVFTFVFFGLNALTGWAFFGWYAYPLAAATIPALVFICERWAPFVPEGVRAIAAALLVALAPTVGVRDYIQQGPRWSIAHNSLLAMSYDLAERMRGRDGLIAMGAIAGVATYVLDRPVLQLEGIVGDRRLVEHVRHEDPLEDVLDEYHADYLVVSLASVRAQAHEGCYLVTQPNAEWAGERTSRLRGEICAEPVERFYTSRGPDAWSRFSGLETLVWDLRGARWKQPDDKDSLDVADETLAARGESHHS